MSKICQGFLEMWSIICTWKIGGHIGSGDLEVGQRSSNLPVKIDSSDSLPSLCKVWLKYIGWL